MGNRNFGELICEKTLMMLDNKISKSGEVRFDLLEDGKRVESKFSRSKMKSKVDEYNIIDFLKGQSEYRFNSLNFKWSVNIQEVKTDLFDILYYGVFLDDYIYIFRISSEDLVNDSNITKSPNREGIQFGIRKTNINYHINNYLYKKLTWDEFIKLWKL